MATEPTFQFVPAGAPQGSLGVQGGSPSLGVDGGRSTVDTNVMRFVDTTDIGAGSNLPEFLSEAFAPKIKAAQQALFWKGFTQAAMGRTQEEISNDVPWYAKVFGPVPYELGAEKFTVDKATADIDTYYMNEMPRLRTMPTEDVAQELQKKAMESVGDDPYTTALLTKSLMDRMGPLLDVHAKARYAWQQEEMVTAQREAGKSAADSFSASRRAMAQLGKDNPNDVEIGYQNEQIKRNLLDAFTPPKYQDPDSTVKFLTGSIRELADNGNFDALAVLHEAGITKVLEPETNSALENYVRTRWNEFKDKSLADDPAFFERYVKVKTARSLGLGGAATVEQMHELNQEYQAKYGYLPLFDGPELASDATQSSLAWVANENRIRAANAEAAAKADTAAAKERAESENMSLLRNAILSGQKGYYEYLKNVEPGDVDRMTTQLYDELKKTKPELAAQMLVWNQASRAKPGEEIQRRIQADIADATAGGPINDAFTGVYREWKAMRQGKAMHLNAVTGELEQTDTVSGPATARIYFGKEADARLQRFDKLVTGSGLPAAAAYSMSFGEDPNERPEIQGATSDDTKKTRAALKATLDSFDAGIVSRVFGDGVQLSDSSKALLSRYLATEYDSSWSGLGGNKETVMKAAYTSAVANGLEVHGTFVWQNPGGSNQKRIAAYFNSNDTAISKSVDTAIKSKLAAIGIDLEQDTPVNVFRLPDEGGQPALLAVALNKDGLTTFTTVHGSDIRAAEMEQVNKMEKMRQAIPEAKPFPIRAGGRNAN